MVCVFLQPPTELSRGSAIRYVLEWTLSCAVLIFLRYFEIRCCSCGFPSRDLSSSVTYELPFGGLQILHKMHWYLLKMEDISRDTLAAEEHHRNVMELKGAAHGEGREILQRSGADPMPKYDEEMTEDTMSMKSMELEAPDQERGMHNPLVRTRAMDIAIEEGILRDHRQEEKTKLMHFENQQHVVEHAVEIGRAHV